MLKPQQRRESSQRQEIAPMPTFAEAQPVWKRLSDRVGTLTSRRNAIHDELRDLEHATAWDNSLIWRGDRRTVADVFIPAKPKPTLRERVKQLLGEFEPPPPPPEPTEPTVTYIDPFTARKAELGKELADIEQALEILLPQLARAHQAASRAFCEANMAAYRSSHAGRVCRALTELGAALGAQADFLNGIQQQGCDPLYFRHVDGASIFGDVRDGTPHLRELLERAIQHGHFSRADLDAAELPAPAASAYVPPPAPATPHTDAVRAKLGRMLPRRRTVVYQS